MDMKTIEQVKQEVLAKCAKVCPNIGDSVEIGPDIVLKNQVLFGGAHGYSFLQKSLMQYDGWDGFMTGTAGQFEFLPINNPQPERSPLNWYIAWCILSQYKQADTIGPEQQIGKEL